MAILRRLNSLTNVGLRGASLAFRFALTFYIAKYLGYEATGLYGLAVGAIAIAQPLIGWGLNYFTSRDIIGVDRPTAAARVKTRLFVTTLSLVAATIVSIGGAFALDFDLRWIYVFIILLVWLETYATDVHVALIAVEMPIAANVLIFVRLALWVPFVIGLGLWLPSFRTLDVVFLGWLASYLIYGALLLWFLRQWPLRAAARAPLEGRWIREKLRGSWFIYLSDIGLTGTMYVDRYIVSFMLGLTLTGIYTFYWSLANALQTLMATAVVQLAVPSLYKAYLQGSAEGWRLTLREYMIRTVALASGMALVVFVVGEIAIHFLSMTELRDYRAIFVMMLVAAVIRSCSDLLNAGLASLKADNHYAVMNMIGIMLSASSAFVMIYAFGFLGIGIASLASAILLAGMRAVYLVRFSKTIGANAPLPVA